MPVFVEDPAQLSVSRLKSDLIAHNVQLPPAKSKKEVYVELHMKHVDQQNAVDFSSDEEEDPVQDVAEQEEEEPEDEEIPDPSSLTDDDLKAALLLQGVKAGPIVASTRALYEKKLRKLLQSNRQNELNGTEQAVLYSDTEEEEEDEEEDNDKESGSGGAKQETAEQSEQDREESRELPHEPSKDPFNDLLPDIETTPTGIYATCRRPIKGAAGRPVQYAYPDTPISPTTLERKEREHHIVPIQIQIAAFFIVMFVMYVVYVFVEDNSFSPLLAFLESQNQASDDEEGLLLPAETQDTPAVFGQE
ncbi:LEM domain-containing protein 1 [Aulostomus maculatus]